MSFCFRHEWATRVQGRKSIWLLFPWDWSLKPCSVIDQRRIWLEGQGNTRHVPLKPPSAVAARSWLSRVYLIPGVRCLALFSPRTVRGDWLLSEWWKSERQSGWGALLWCIGLRQSHIAHHPSEESNHQRSETQLNIPAGRVENVRHTSAKSLSLAAVPSTGLAERSRIFLSTQRKARVHPGNRFHVTEEPQSSIIVEKSSNLLQFSRPFRQPGSTRLEIYLF